MSIKIDGEVIETVHEVFSIRRKSTDGQVEEVTFLDEAEAELEQRFYGGQLWRRTMYVTVGEPVETDYPAEMPAA